jgi:3-deoxy-D-manno-octulosonic-acid transferase
MDAPAPPVDAENLAQLMPAIGGRPLFLAASTHANEEELVAGVHQALRADVPALLTVIAPRHPERGPAIAAQLAQLGLKVQRRSAGELPEPGTDIYLADTIGELGTLFALKPLCFMGGSLVPHGGQNPIEAVKHGCGVLTGPHIANFADTYEALLEDKGARTVTSADELRAAVAELLLGPEKLSVMRRRADAVITKMTGALDRSLAALAPLLPPPAASGAGSGAGSGLAQAKLAGTGSPPDPLDSVPVPQPGLQHAD